MERFKSEGRSVTSELRRRAEGRLIEQVADPSSQKEHDPQRLLHELQVHQIELEMQNEELSRVQNDLESRVRERTAELERINSEQELFRYAISHEFRAPLVRLEGFATIMTDVLRDDGEDQVIHCARRIMAATISLRTVIDSLLTLNRLSRAEMHIQDIDISEMVKHIVAELAEEVGQRLPHFLIAPGVKATGDKHLLEICLRNLLGNAVKFSSKNPAAQVEFGQKKVNGGETVYFVKDNGVGFDAESTRMNFQPFCRMHSQEEFEGTGIGLALVQRILEKHGGQIRVETSPGKGATFSFTLASVQAKRSLPGVRNGNRN